MIFAYSSGIRFWERECRNIREIKQYLTNKLKKFELIDFYKEKLQKLILT